MLIVLDDGHGGVVGPAQIGGVGGVEGFALKLLPQLLRLGTPKLVEGNVGRTLDDPIAVGRGLATKR